MVRIYLFISMTVMFFCVSTASADEVRIATGHTFIKRVFDPVRSAFMDKTGIDINIIYHDPVPALAELEKGNADVAGASLPLEDWLALAKKMGVPVQEISAYGSYVPVIERSMIAVNTANKVNALSKEQLKGIFTGKILNWQEVGGADAPILVVWPAISSGAVIIFKAKVLDNEPITKTVYDVESMGDIPDAIAATPEAIGIVTGLKVEAGLKEVAPAIERPLTLVYKAKPVPTLQKLLDFLKGDGKIYIK